MPENRRLGLTALAITIFCFGTMWTSAKVAVDHVPPLWFTSGRFLIGALTVFLVLAIAGQLRWPPRSDIPVILSVGCLMFGLYSSLFQTALEFVHAGRATILGYTPAIFVTPLAVLLLGERLSRVRLAGLIAAMAGFLTLFNPGELDWSDPDTLTGNGMIVLGVMLWSCTILHLRVHRQISDTLQLVPFSMLTASLVSGCFAIGLEGWPDFETTPVVWGLFLYTGIICSAIGNWAVTTSIKNLPSAVSTVGFLGVPVVALAISVMFLGEVFTISLAIGMALIVGGIAMTTVSRDT